MISLLPLLAALLHSTPPAAARAHPRADAHVVRHAASRATSPVAPVAPVLPVAPVGAVFSGRAKQLQVKPPRFDAQINVDGVLDEPVWRDAAVLTGFSQYAPVDGLPAADSTQVLVWYSPTAIHFGIRAFQPKETVRATLADRDRISQDDNVQVYLSTFNDGRQASVFMVNPLGIQADGTLVERGNITGGGFSGGIGAAREAPDLTPDYVFASKGHVTDWGYEVEVRIPFKSLKYQSLDIQSWGINVVRVVQYRGHENSWVPALRGSATFLGQNGTLTELSDLRRGLVVDVTPEITQRTDGTPATSGGAWNYSAGSPKLGGNLRWGITNNLTMNGTVNPDFSQVEADAGQISFDPRAALSYPEKRPFFLDGIEQFAVPNTLIYTRRVVQPVAAAKMAGKVGNTDIAVLSAIDATTASTTGRDNPLFNILRLQRDIGPASRIGMMYTDRINGKDWNRVLDVDGRQVWNTIYSVQWQLAGSATSNNGVQTNAPLWDTRFNRDGRGFSWRSQFTGIADDFRTESGFISRAGQVHAAFVPRWSWFGERGALLEQISPDVVMDGIWAYKNFFHAGDARDKKLHFDINTQWRGGWTVGGSLLLESFGYDPAFYSDKYRIEQPHQGRASDTLAFTGTPRLPNRDYVITIGTPQFKYLSLNTTYIFGQDENFYEWSSAAITYWSVTANIRASEQLRIGLTYTLNDYRRQSNGQRVGRQQDPRVKLEYQVSQAMFVRVIGEYFADYTSELFDDSRTGLPLLQKVGTAWRHLGAVTNNGVRGEFLFAYKPTPGTVFYAGYGSQMSEPESFSFRNVTRQNDNFFLKASYLFRM